MKTIEEAIQSRFRNEQHKAIVNLFYTSKHMESKIDGFLKEYHITQQQYNILRILRGASPKPVSLKYIKERMLDKMPDTSRVVDKLLFKKLLSRTECPQDRRLVDIGITEKGLKLLDEMDKQSSQLDSLCDSLTQEELLQLNYLLDKFRDER